MVFISRPAIVYVRYMLLYPQGEVEHIALLKPKAQTESDDGMLEFLEDIIGSSQFKEPIEQLSKRVEELNEARREKVHFSLDNITVYLPCQIVNIFPNYIGHF